eukprot:6263044-Prymnesium_polylepis.1
MLGFATIGQVEGFVIAETTVARGCSGGQLSFVPRTHDVEVVRGDLGWSIRVQKALEMAGWDRPLCRAELLDQRREF